MKIYYTDIYKALKGKKLQDLAKDDWKLLIKGKKLKTRKEKFYADLIFMEEQLKKEGYINDDLSITKTGEIFMKIYERSWYLFPTGRIEFFAKDFPFTAGALVLVLGNSILLLVPLIISSLKTLFNLIIV